MFLNPLNIFGNPLTAFGEMSIPILISNFITLIGFLFATWFAARYTDIFYGGRPKPKSWLFIISGLLSLSLSEIGQFLLPYRINPMIIEGAFVLIAQSLGAILITIGCYLLSREIA